MAASKKKMILWSESAWVKLLPWVEIICTTKYFGETAVLRFIAVLHLNFLQCTINQT